MCVNWESSHDVPGVLSLPAEGIEVLPESSLSELTQLAAQICNVPMAQLQTRANGCYSYESSVPPVATTAVTLLDEYVMAQAKPIVVPDVLADSQFNIRCDSGQTTDDACIRFYAGVPLRSPDGMVQGVLSVMDVVPQDLLPAKRQALALLSRQATALFDWQHCRNQLALASPSSSPWSTGVNSISPTGSPNLSDLQPFEWLSQRESSGAPNFNSAIHDAIADGSTAGRSIHSQPLPLTSEPAPIATHGLQLSDAHYQMLFENNPQPMWVYDLETLKFLEVNYAATHHYGYTKAEFSQLTIADIRPAEEVPALLDNVSQVTEGLDAAGIWKHLKKDGTLLEVDVRSHTLTFAGRPAEIVIIHDVTEQRHIQKQLDQFFELSLDIFCIAGVDGYFKHVNPAFGSTLGCLPEDLLKQPIVDFIHPDDQAATLNEIEKLSRDIPTVYFENRYRRQDNTYCWIAWRAIPAEGLIYAVGRDITQLKQDEAERQQLLARAQASSAAAESARNRLGDILKSITAGFFVVDLAWNFSYVNAQAAQMLQRSPNDMLGKRLWSEFPDFLLLPFWWQFNAAMAKQAAVQFEVFYPQLETWFAVHAYPAARGLSVYFQDITTYKQAESLLRASEIRFRTIVETAHEGIWMIDTSANTTYVNQHMADMLGYKPEEMQGMPLFAFMDEQAQLEAQQLLQARSKGVVEQHDFRFRHQQGTDVWLICSVTPLLDDTKTFVGALGMFADITARKQAENQLQSYAQRLEGMRTIDQAILAKRLPDEIARAALDHLSQLIKFQQAMVILFDDQVREARVLAAVSGNGELTFPEGSLLPVHDFPPMSKFMAGSAYVVSDIDQVNQPPLLLQCLLATGLRSMVASPMIVDGEVIGELLLTDARVGAFTPEHEAIAAEVCNQVAIAIQNARLFRQIDYDRERLQTLSGQLIETQEKERRHIAHELHDEIGQALTAVKINLHVLERSLQHVGQAWPIQDSVKIVDDALQQVRNLSLDLRPSLLDDLGLVPALRWYIDRQAQRSGIHHEFVCGLLSATLPGHLSTACFRIVQEAITNAMRYASATHVRVELHQHQDDLHLYIQDDGVGFDVAAAWKQATKGSSLGLIGMAERASLVGGVLYMVSTPQSGTQICVCLPISGVMTEKFSCSDIEGHCAKGLPLYHDDG